MSGPDLTSRGYTALYIIRTSWFDTTPLEIFGLQT